MTRVLVDPTGQTHMDRAARLLATGISAVVGDAVPVDILPTPCNGHGDAGPSTWSGLARPGDVVLLETSDPSATLPGPEAHRIDVGDVVVIRAATSAGACHAAQQVLQNLRATGSVPRGRVRSMPVVRERGLHLDIARKRFDTRWILDRLRVMAAAGLNTLQLHLSDNEGVGLVAPTMPEIASPGALRPEELTEILAAAADLHIEVVPSLDMPGHLGRVLSFHQELQLRDAGRRPVLGALDLGDPRAWELADRLVDAYIPLFPDARRWIVGCDEFVDFTAVARYPRLLEAAHRCVGPSATVFDLLTMFANHVAGGLRRLGITTRVWNDGAFRSSVTTLDNDIEVAWWTNWSEGMAPLSARDRDDNRRVLNFDDQHLYYVLGEHAGYQHPTAARLWADDWHPGLFTPLWNGAAQGFPRPALAPAPTEAPDGGAARAPSTPFYPGELLGTFASVWCDLSRAESPQDIASRLDPFLLAFGERAWNGGSCLDLAQVEALTRALLSA